MRLERISDRVMAVVILALVLVSHLCGPNTDLSDSVWSVHTAMSIIRQGNTDLDEYQELTSLITPPGPAWVAIERSLTAPELGRRGNPIQ